MSRKNMLVGIIVAVFMVGMVGTAFASAAHEQAKGKTVRIEFWTLLSGQIGKELAVLINQYNTQQHQVRIVNVNNGSYDAQQEKLLAAAAAGNFPPVAMFDYKNVPYYGVNGWLQPLNTLATKKELSSFIPGLLTDLTVKGKVYALPYNRSTQGLYYNKDLFAKAGLNPNEPPKTWNDVVQYGKKIDALGSSYHGIYATGNMQWYYEPMVYEWGGHFSNANCQFTFNKGPGLEVARFLQDMVFKSKVAVVPSNLSGSWDQQAVGFVNGKVAMMRQSTALNKYISNVVSFHWGFAMFPAGPKGRYVTGGGANIGISAKASAATQQESWTFVKWLTDANNAAKFSMSTGYLPSSYAAQNLPVMQAFYKTHPTWLVSLHELQYTHPTSCAVLNSPSWGTSIQTALNRIIVNGANPKTVLDQTVAKLNAKINAAATAGTLVVK